MDTNKLTEELEKVSQKYTEVFKVKRNGDWYILKLQEELGELIQSYLMMIGQARPKGKTPEQMREEFNKEVADVFCHTLLLAKFHNVDLEKEVREKWLVWNKEE